MAPPCIDSSASHLHEPTRPLWDRPLIVTKAAAFAASTTNAGIWPAQTASLFPESVADFLAKAPRVVLICCNLAAEKGLLTSFYGSATHRK